MSNNARKFIRAIFTRAAATDKPAPALNLLSTQEASQVSGGAGGLVNGGFSPIRYRPGQPGPTNPTQW